jgi:hypothetical protein
MSEVTMTKLAAALQQLDPEDPCLVFHAWEMAKVPEEGKEEVDAD